MTSTIAKSRKERAGFLLALREEINLLSTLRRPGHDINNRNTRAGVVYR